MIEVVSEPRDLSTWDKNQNPFYLELYGETSPTVDEAHAEVLPSAESSVRTTTDAPVYEYWWTLGHGGTPTRPRWPHTRGKEPWQDLRSTAAHVFLYFPLSAGWRVSEIAATLKYLSPVPEQHDWLKAVARGLHEVQPLFADASRVADFVPGGGATSKWLQAVSKLQVSSVPSGSNLKWSVRRVTFGSESGVMQGVMWTISRAAFDRLGGRLTGSLAVSFLPARSQEPDRVRDLPPYQEADLLAHAGVFGHSQARWLPDKDESGHRFVHLRVAPQSSPSYELPAAGARLHKAGVAQHLLSGGPSQGQQGRGIPGAASWAAAQRIRKSLVQRCIGDLGVLFEPIADQAAEGYPTGLGLPLELLFEIARDAQGDRDRPRVVATRQAIRLRVAKA